MSLTDFLTAIVAEKYASVALEEYQRADIVRDLAERLTKFITLTVLTELAMKNRELLIKFQALAKGTTEPEVIAGFIEGEIPDGAAFLGKVLTDFRALYLANSSH